MCAVIDQPQTDETIPTISECDELLLKAENYIRERGWCQGNYWNADGAVCITGALVRVSGESVGGNPDELVVIWKAFFNHHRQNVVGLCLQRLNDLVGRSVMEWNDEIGRTKEEVIDLLRQARDF